MKYSDLIVLIPSHSLEDFPTDLSEPEASSLLNASVIGWHPAILKSAGVIPSWHRADEPPETLDSRLILVPNVCKSWLPAGWIDRARGEGAVIVLPESDRNEAAAAALEPLEYDGHCDDDLVRDFYALGSCYLQMELLTRHMHHFSSLDEVHLQREAVAAAEAALADDQEGAHEHLRTCFETLTEARERFYPVDCYLIDLCLLIPRLADDHFKALLLDPQPTNVLATTKDLDEIRTEHPDFAPLMKEAWEAGRIDFVGGEYEEIAAPLVPLESWLAEFSHGLGCFQKWFGRQPKTWGRRRYGLATMLPQILTKFGYHSALHLVLDDGLYPDSEHSKVRWEGCDGTVLDATSRIPLAGDSATSYLRFAMRMAESMEEDQVAALLLARWPEVKSPWFDDFRRMNRYSPVLGRFITLDEFFQQTDAPGRLSSFSAKDYLTPFLTQAVAMREANPISRYGDHFHRRAQFDAARWCRSTAAVLRGKPVDEAETEVLEGKIELASRESTEEHTVQADTLLQDFTETTSKSLAKVVMSNAGATPGYVVINPCSFARSVVLDLPELAGPPPLDDVVRAVQFDGQRKMVEVQVPGAGFAWFPSSPHDNPPVSKEQSIPLAEDLLLRNPQFEVQLSEVTGGIQRIKGYGRSANRLSQQIAFRFPRERTISVGEGDFVEETKTWYSEMRLFNSEVKSTGPTVGEIVTTGEIVDQKQGKRLAGFEQTTRVWRNRPIVEFEIELDIDQMPEGDPWSNYFACRFAWNDSAASVTRSLLGGAQPFVGERFESPDYVELATESQRTTILNNGLPFHRKTGPRMVDTLLVVEGETKRRFHFAVAVDENYPMQAAMDFTSPVCVVPTTNGPPSMGSSGWFFHVNAKNVQITRVMDLAGVPPENLEPWERHDQPVRPSGNGFAVRLVETEGRHKVTKLRCFRKPTRARQRDFLGRTITELSLQDDVVLVEMTAYEVADVELFFDE